MLKEDVENKNPQSKHITTNDFDKFSGTVFEKRLNQASLAINKDLDAVLSKMRKKIEKLQIFYFSYFLGKSHFEDDGMENFFVLKPVFNYFKKAANSSEMAAWKSENLIEESIKLYATSDNSVSPG